jgi:hypothetical protein
MPEKIKEKMLRRMLLRMRVKTLERRRGRRQ